ncbi:MAG: hypothetical protein R3C30_07380 [Hyphomonadaceae bacterium]
MILRRIIAHFRKQEWTAIGIDLVIVVFGVFIGIQVANWNEGRIERLQERGFLVRLHEDFTQSIAGQARDLAFLDQQLADQAAILRSLDACAVAPEDQIAFQRGIGALGYINPPRLYRRTIDEIGASGETDIIRNDALKRRLADIVALVEWRANGFEQTTRTTEHYRYIVEGRTRYDFERSFYDPFLGDVLGVNFDIRALCRDPAIASAVSAISQATRERRRAYQPILDQYEAFLPMLEGEVQQRWGVRLEAEATP